ncbi:MAG: flavin reductase family protein [Bacteroidia bacterium]|nr:flavin reductase family protein [Bacteroidia bacterium]
MRHIDPSKHPVPFVHRLLLGGVAPRPIALVSSMDADGNVNLSPFSFFNAFGANPPIIVVSPAYRGKDGTPKHTFENIVATKEFTVSAVTFDMVEKISLASSDYPRGVNEFVKAGFTPLASNVVSPPGVAESPFVMECRLLQHIDTGAKPASGNLLVAEVLMFHVRESVFDGERIDPRRMDLVARMGGDWYCRAHGDALFELPKPSHNGIGIDALPGHLRTSTVLTGNDLAKLAGVAALPDAEAIRLRWLQDIERIFVEQHSADMFDVELRAGNPRGALLCVLKEWKAGLLDTQQRSFRLLQCTRAFLAAGELDQAWECAVMSTGTE